MNSDEGFFPQTTQEHDDYIIKHASHFTVTFRWGMRQTTLECPNLDTSKAKAMVAANILRKNVLIYAVSGPLQAYVGAMHYNKDGVVFVPGRDGKVR